MADRLGARVLLVDPSQKGGIPFYTAMIAESLAAVGLRPMVLAHRLLARSTISPVWKIYRWLPSIRWPRPPEAPPASEWEQARIWVACAVTIIFAVLLLRPRVVHLQFPIHPRLDSLLLRTLSCIVPVVVTAHDVIPHDPGTNAVQRARRTYRAVNLVLVHSAPAALEIEAIAGVEVIVVAHPAIQLAIKPDRTLARKKFGLDSTARVAAAVGFIRGYKGYALLADIWDQLGDDAPLLFLLGELVDQGQSPFIERLRLHPRVHMRLGYASDEDVIAACAAADLVLLPYERGSDSGILHIARAVGTPVLASDMKQLAAAVVSTSAGRVLPRDPLLWIEALREPPPPAPPRPPSISVTGQAHRAAYRQAQESWRRRSRTFVTIPARRKR